MLGKSILCACVLALGTTFTMTAAAQESAPLAEQSEARTDIGRALDRYMSDEGDTLILLPHRLNKQNLDYSMESLLELDAWLNSIHTVNRMEAGEGRVGDMIKLDGRGDNSVMFAGLYLGEVVRLNANQDWYWQPFETFVNANPYYLDYFGKEPGFDTYVLVSSQGAATPMNAALKRVINGPVDSVSYMGQFLSQPVDINLALDGTDYTGLSAMGPVPDAFPLDTPVE